MARAANLGREADSWKHIGAKIWPKAEEEVQDAEQDEEHHRLNKLPKNRHESKVHSQKNKPDHVELFAADLLYKQDGGNRARDAHTRNNHRLPGRSEQSLLSKDVL